MSAQCLSANAPCAIFANTDRACDICQRSYDEYVEKAQRPHREQMAREARIAELEAEVSALRRQLTDLHQIRRDVATMRRRTNPR